MRHLLLLARSMHRAATSSGHAACRQLPSSASYCIQPTTQQQHHHYGSGQLGQLAIQGGSWRVLPAAATPASAAWRRGLTVVAAGLPFSLSKPQKVLNFKWGRRVSGYSVSDLQVEVDALSEGRPAGLSTAEVQQLLEQLQQDAEEAVPLALQAKQQAQPGYRLPAIANLSLVLCDDAHIRSLNREYRGKDAPTDVLSFEIPDESPALQLPVKLLGDLVISLDTATRQADERG